MDSHFSLSSIAFAALVVLVAFAGCLTSETSSDMEFPDSTNNQTGAKSQSLLDDVVITEFAGFAQIDGLPTNVSYSYGPQNDAWIRTAQSNETSVIIPFLEPRTKYVIEIHASEVNSTLEFSTRSRNHTTPDFDSAQVYPGMGVGGCTIGVILRDATDDVWYALTAGHCFTDADIGRPASNNYLIPIGTYVAREDPRDALDRFADWGLIELNVDARAATNPGHHRFGGPTGLGEPSRLVSGQLVCTGGTSQIGLHFDQFVHRCGYVTSMRETSIQASTANAGGDSGSILIDGEDGGALGILSGAGTDGHSYYSICQALGRMEAIGFELQLLTSPLDLRKLQPLPPSVEPVNMPYQNDSAPCPVSVMGRHP